MANWHYLQHVPFEGPGHLESLLRDRGIALSRTELWNSTMFPGLAEFDGLFVLGGPMNVYEEDQYPWLAAEKDFIQRAVAAGKPTLGICLGAQLLSVVLGGKVTKNAQKEIGWFPVDLTNEGRASALFAGFPHRFDAFHWHGDRFSIPPGAAHLARSEACDTQAFAYGDRVVALQFHLESTEHSIASLVEHCAGDIVAAPYVQDRSAIRHSAERLPTAHALLETLLDRLIARA